MSPRLNHWNLICLTVGGLVACVASVSNRVIARKLERKQKKRLKGEGEVPSFPSPSPIIHLFFCSCPSFLDEPREETLATQARGLVIANGECHFQFQTLHSVTHTNIESKDTSLQDFFISFLFKTKDPWRKQCSKLLINRTQLTVFIYVSFTLYVINSDGKTNNKCKQGANTDLNPRKVDPLKFSYSTWQLF